MIAQMEIANNPVRNFAFYPSPTARLTSLPWHPFCFVSDRHHLLLERTRQRNRQIITMTKELPVWHAAHCVCLGGAMDMLYIKILCLIRMTLTDERAGGARGIKFALKEEIGHVATCCTLETELARFFDFLDRRN